MSRTVKHFSLHRIASTELRVFSDVEDGVLPLIQVEEATIQEYAKSPTWPHRWISLFILQDLQPLVRQLHQGDRPGGLAPSTKYSFSPADVAALSERPIVNLYDLADLSTLNIFVNHREMLAQDYWQDMLALKGLFAHEHAHPLAENETTRSSRQVKLEIAGDSSPVEGIGDRKTRIVRVLAALANKLGLLAAREIFANQVTIQNGFAGALFYLNSRNLENARTSVGDRQELARRLRQELAASDLTREGGDLLLLVGDLNGYLPLALEVAPFYRTGREKDAKSLEEALETAVFPLLDPLAVRTFYALRDLYTALPDNLSLPDARTWISEVLDVLFEGVAEKGMTLPYRLG